MTTIKTNELKNGVKIIQDGTPYIVISHEHVSPGKGQAFVKILYRNLLTSRVLEKTFKSGEAIEVAEVMELELQYLYNDGEFWHFMDKESYEQYQVDINVAGSVKQWLIEQDTCVLTFWNTEVINIVPPNFITAEVSQTDPGLKGDTASGGSKPAVISTGETINVPLFVEQGDFIKVYTREGSYISRTKK